MSKQNSSNCLYDVCALVSILGELSILRCDSELEMERDHFLRLLQEVLTANTERVKAATAELKSKYYTSPESLPVLIEFLTSEELEIPVRQLAATQARALLGQHWKSVPPNVKLDIRSHLLRSALNEQASVVRNAIARVISAIAKKDAEKGQWAELPSLMVRAAQRPDVRQREVGTYILHALLDSREDGMADSFEELLALFSKTLHDPESFEVRINTSRALCSIARAFDSEVEESLCVSFQAVVPGMVTVLKESIDSGDEARTIVAFEGFQTLLECGEPRLLNQHFRELIQFMANIGVDKSADDEVRTQSLSFLLTACTYRKTKFQSLRIAEQLTMAMLEIIVESADEEDVDDDDTTPKTLAIALLAVMTENLPPSQTIAPLLNVFRNFVSSSDPARRQAIIEALGACVDCAPDFISTQISSFFPGLLKLLDDPHVRVREAAVKGIRYLADQLADDLGQEHEKLIPALARNLARSVREQAGSEAKLNLSIVASCCDALEALVDGMNAEDVRPYVHELIPHLIDLFAHPDPKVQLAAVAAVGTMAVSAESDFIPYFQKTVHALSRFIASTEGDDELNLRSIACDAMGNLAVAVGPEIFQPYVDSMMTATIEGMSLGSPRLKETAFLFWVDMVKVYKEEFKPFLPGIAERLLESLEQEESAVDVELGAAAADLIGKEVVVGGAKVRVAAASDGDEDVSVADDDGSEWDDENIGASQITFEKVVAVECIGNVVVFAPQEYFPYLEKSITKLCSLLNHEYGELQKAAVSTLYRIYGALWDLQDDAQKSWQPGFPVKVQPNNMLAELAPLITPQSLVIWAETYEREVAVGVAESVTSIIRKCGLSVVTTEDVKNIIQTVTSIVNGEHNCQQNMMGDDDDGDLAETSTSESDWAVIEGSLDMLSALAKALGAQFAEIWKIFAKTVFGYASSSARPERITACGVIAECIQGMGNAVTPFTTALLKLLLHRLGDEDEEVKANAAFATGMLVEKSDKSAEIVKAYNQILAKLEPMLQGKASRQLDNAAGCLSRMIMKHKDHVPLGDVLPVLLSRLPLAYDYDENPPVYKMIVGLFSSGETALTNLTPQLIPILAEVMDEAEEQLDDETTKLITQLVKFIYEKKPDIIESHPSLMAAAQA